MIKTIYESAFDDENVKDYDFGSDIVMADSKDYDHYEYALRFDIYYETNSKAPFWKSKETVAEFANAISDEIENICKYTPCINDMSQPQFNGWMLVKHEQYKLPKAPELVDGVNLDGGKYGATLYELMFCDDGYNISVFFKFNISDSIKNNRKFTIQHIIYMIDRIWTTLEDIAYQVYPETPDGFTGHISALIYNTRTDIINRIDYSGNVRDTVKCMDLISQIIYGDDTLFDEYPKDIISKHSFKEDINDNINRLYTYMFQSELGSDYRYKYDRKSNSIVIIPPKCKSLSFVPNLNDINENRIYRSFKFNLSNIDEFVIEIALRADLTQDLINEVMDLFHQYIFVSPSKFRLRLALPHNAPKTDDIHTYVYINSLNVGILDFSSVSTIKEVYVECPWKDQKIRSILPFKFDDNVNVIYV